MTKVAITFPIHERTVTEMIGCVLYTMVIKGNDVVFIDPPGKNHPLYQRAHYREIRRGGWKVNRFRHEGRSEMVVIHGVEVRTEIEELVDPDFCAVMVVDMVNEDVSPRGRLRQARV